MLIIFKSQNSFVRLLYGFELWFSWTCTFKTIKKYVRILVKDVWIPESKNVWNRPFLSFLSNVQLIRWVKKWFMCSLYSYFVFICFVYYLIELCTLVNVVWYIKKGLRRTVNNPFRVKTLLQYIITGTTTRVNIYSTVFNYSVYG